MFGSNHNTKCKKSKDGSHYWETTYGDDMAKDVKCKNCGVGSWERYY